MSALPPGLRPVIGNEAVTSPLKPLPRLRIHHLMLWTALTAGWLAVARQLDNPARSLEQRSVFQINLFVTAILWGGVSTVAGLGVYWRRKGMAFYTQPGQWLVSWYMLSILWQIVVNLAILWAVEATGSPPFRSLNESWPIWLVFNPWTKFVILLACFAFLAWYAADTSA